MALDVGDKTIGVAVTDEMQFFAHPVTTIKRTQLQKDIAGVMKCIEEYSVGTLVVGLPLLSDGTEGIQAGKIRKFIEVFKKAASHGGKALNVETWDESMTTFEAHEVMGQAGLTTKKRKKIVDKLAAVFILESYMRGKGIA